MTATRRARRRLLVPTCDGRTRAPILRDLGNGVCIIHAVNAPGFSVTHVPTGYAFFSQIQRLAIARKVAKVTAAVADWSKATSVPKVENVWKRLPKELREWFPRASREFSADTIEAAKRRTA